MVNSEPTSLYLSHLRPVDTHLAFSLPFIVHVDQRR